MSENEKLISIFPALAGWDLPVEEPDLEVAVGNALKRGGVHMVSQLLELTSTELMGMFPNRKQASYEDVLYRLTCLAEGTEETLQTCDVPLSGGFAGPQRLARAGGSISEILFELFQDFGFGKSKS